MADFDAKAHLAASARRAQTLLTNDINALSAEAQTTQHGGCVLTPVKMVAECAAFNSFIADLASGAPVSPPQEGWREALFAQYNTTEKAVAFLETSTEKLAAACEKLDASTMGEVIETPMGRPMTRFALIEMPIGHMTYHDGQLNYIQALHGDSAMHW